MAVQAQPSFSFDHAEKAKSLISALNLVSRDLPHHLFNTVSSIYSGSQDCGNADGDGEVPVEFQPLAELRRKVRSEISSEHQLHFNCAFPGNRLFDWGMKRFPPTLYGVGDAFAMVADDQFRKKRDAERLSRLEEEWNFMETRKRKNFAEVFSARDSRSKLKKSLKRQKEKRNEKILAWHLEQRTWRAKVNRYDKLRLQALNADDQKAYMRLVKESKNERLTMLLQGTNRLLFNLGAAVQHQKDAKHADSIGPVEESDADMNELDGARNRSPSDASLEDDEDIVDSDRNDDNGDLLKGQRRYNATIHSVQEKVHSRALST